MKEILTKARPVPAVAPTSSKLARATESDRLVERAVLELNAICKSATLDFALAVGHFVIKTLYSSDLGAWRRRDPVKRNSLRKLARHPDLAMSPDALYRSVAMYELCERIGIRSYRHLSTSHLRLVLPLSSVEQERLLRATEEAAWSVRRLDEEIGCLILRDPSTRVVRGGRKRHSRLNEAVRVARRCAGALNEVLTQDDDSEDVSPESTRTAVDILRGVQEACARLERRLEQHLPRAQSVPRAP